MTIVFTTFVFLQFFNAINCRVIGENEYNIFKKFFNSVYFIFALVIIAGVQYSACEFDIIRIVFDTAEINGQQFGQCIFVAFSVLFAAFLLKLTPDSWVQNMPEFNENEKPKGWIMENYAKQKKGENSEEYKKEAEKLEEGK